MTYSSKTGRGVAEVPTGVALHQWKRDKLFRQIVRAPEGYTLIEADFAGQEYRWMAVESGDPIMQELCLPGEDAHGFMAGKISGRPYDEILAAVRTEDPAIKPVRQLGKVGNLSCQYRTSAVTLMKVAAVQHKTALTFSEAKNIVNTYRRTYRQVPKYWQRAIDFAKINGYAQTLAGRRVWLGYGGDWDQSMKWSHESTAINFPIQGVGADQKYLAMLVLRDYLPKVDGRFYFELHDGLFIVVPDAQAKRAAHDVKRLLSNLPYAKAWGVNLPVEFPVDVKMGKTWGDLKEVH